MMESERILLVTPRYPPAQGGVERVVEMLAAGLVRRRFGVDVATTDPSRSLPPFEAREGLSVRRFPTIRNDDVFFLSPRLAFWLLRNAGAYDLVHAHSYHTPLALIGAIAARFHRVPFVVSPHYHGTGHTAARRFLHRPYRLFGSWMIRQAALVICCSEAERALVRHHFGAGIPTTVVQYGVDAIPATARATRPATNGKTILAGGRLEAYKQVGIVVSALQRLPLDFRLIIFGDGPALPEIRAEAHSIGVGGRVDFVGRVSDDELRLQFRAADVFVSMSRNEAFGLTVAEAAAAGTAIICSDIPAYREMADRLPEDAIRLLDVDVDPAVLAEAIRMTAEKPRPAAGALSSIPTWDEMAAQTVEGFRSVFGRRRRAQPRQSS
jgi:glycosyltransferase involved in cell wall biosynthesis